MDQFNIALNVLLVLPFEAHISAVPSHFRSHRLTLDILKEQMAGGKYHCQCLVAITHSECFYDAGALVSLDAHCLPVPAPDVWQYSNKCHETNIIEKVGTPTTNNLTLLQKLD